MTNRDIIIIGAGHNGLVAAYYLAKAGLKPLVLERREMVGGASVTEEFYPGFRCSTLATSAGPLLPQIINDLQLQKYDVEFIKPSTQVCALNHGAPICIYDDAKRTADYQQAQLISNQDIAVGYYSRGYLSTITKPEVKGVARYLTRDQFFATTWLDR